MMGEEKEKFHTSEERKGEEKKRRAGGEMIRQVIHLWEIRGEEERGEKKEGEGRCGTFTGAMRGEAPRLKRK